MKAAWAERSAWHNFNVELLEQAFTTSSIAKDYGWYPGTRSFRGRPPPLLDQIEAFRRDMAESLDRLRSIVRRLHLIEEVRFAATSPTVPIPSSNGSQGESQFRSGHRYQVTFTDWHSEKELRLTGLTFVMPIWVGWPNLEMEMVGYCFFDSDGEPWYVSDAHLIDAVESE
jgi:hypothetical protein